MRRRQCIPGLQTCVFYCANLSFFKHYVVKNKEKQKFQSFSWQLLQRIYSSICAPSSSQSEPIAIWSSEKQKGQIVNNYSHTHPAEVMCEATNDSSTYEHLNNNYSPQKQVLPPVCSAAVSKFLHLILTESEVPGARGKVLMSELDAMSTGSLLLLELLLELEWRKTYLIITWSTDGTQTSKSASIVTNILSSFIFLNIHW